MFRSSREKLAHPAFLGIYVMLAVIAFEADSYPLYVFGIALAAAISFVAWMLSLRRLLAMSGTPTSRIGSAAQGYVELTGRGRNLPEFQVLSRLTFLPCLWYEYKVEQKGSNDKWQTIDRGRSTESFVLDDGSGQCVVDPEHAEVIPAKTENWTQGDYRYTESLLLASETIYLLGEFSTLGGEHLDLDVRRDGGALLAEWKKNQTKLLERFDLDKDGLLSEREWELARLQAKREVRKTHAELRAQPGTHMLHKPRDGRLFLISSVDATKLARRYRLWAWLHLIFLVAFIAGAAVMWSAPGATFVAR
jgi:hypothetical protein